MAVRAIEAALAQNGGSLGLTAAQEMVKQELANSLKVTTILTPEQLDLLNDLCPELAIIYEPKDTVVNDHVILVALRALVREVYKKTAGIKDLTLDTLVVGASSREYRMYRDKKNFSFWFYKTRGADVFRTVIDALQQILEKLQKKRKKKTIASKYNTIQELLKGLMASETVPTNCFGADDELPKVQVLLMEDTAYYYSSEDWCNLFEKTGAIAAFAYMMLPYEINFPDMPQNPLYSYYVTERDGKMLSVMNYPCGYSNGYTHETKAWTALANNCIHTNGRIWLVSEIVSRVGPFAVIKIARADPGSYVTRTIELPERLRYVKVLDIYASVNKRTGRVRRLKYFTVNEREMFEARDFLLSMHGKTPITINDAMMYIRRRMGGVAMINKTLSKRWQLKRAEAYPLAWAMVLEVELQKGKRDMINRNINPTSVFEKFSVAFRNFRDAITWPISDFIDWLYAELLTDKIIIWPGHDFIDHQLVRVGRYDTRSLDEIQLPGDEPYHPEDDPTALVEEPDGSIPLSVPLPVGPEDEDLPNLENDPDLEDDPPEPPVVNPDCPVCTSVSFSDFLVPKDGKIAQKIVCEHKDSTHRFYVPEKRLDEIKAECIDFESTSKKPGLIEAHKIFRQSMPNRVDHTCKVFYIRGGPGVGKSVFIRLLHKLLKKHGVANKVVSPFSKLAADYPDDPATDTYYYYKTTHRICQTKSGDGKSEVNLPGTYGYLFVDEMTGMNYEFIACAAAKFNVDGVFFVGDIKQTGLREDKGEGVSILSQVNFTDISVHTLLVNYRNPGWVPDYLVAHHGYNMESAENRNVPPIFVKAAERKDIVPTSKVVEMYFSASGWLYYHPAEESVPEGEKFTVRANQGSTHDNVVLFVAPIDKDLTEVSALEIVALSRHRNQLYIVYEPSDARCLTVITKWRDQISTAGAIATEIRKRPAVRSKPEIPREPLDIDFTTPEDRYVFESLFKSDSEIYALHRRLMRDGEDYWVEMATYFHQIGFGPRPRTSEYFEALMKPLISDWVGKKVFIYGVGRDLTFATSLAMKTSVVVDVSDNIEIVSNGQVNVLPQDDFSPKITGFYDLIIVDKSLHRVPLKKRETIVKLLGSKVSPGGLLYFSDHDPNAVREEFYRYVAMFFTVAGSTRDNTCEGLTSPDAVRAWLLDYWLAPIVATRPTRATGNVKMIFKHKESVPKPMNPMPEPSAPPMTLESPLYHHGPKPSAPPATVGDVEDLVSEVAKVEISADAIIRAAFSSFPKESKTVPAQAPVEASADAIIRAAFSSFPKVPKTVPAQEILKSAPKVPKDAPKFVPKESDFPSVPSDPMPSSFEAATCSYCCSGFRQAFCDYCCLLLIAAPAGGSGKEEIPDELPAAYRKKPLPTPPKIGVHGYYPWDVTDPVDPVGKAEATALQDLINLLGVQEADVYMELQFALSKNGCRVAHYNVLDMTFVALFYPSDMDHLTLNDFPFCKYTTLTSIDTAYGKDGKQEVAEEEEIIFIVDIVEARKQQEIRDFGKPLADWKKEILARARAATSWESKHAHHQLALHLGVDGEAAIAVQENARDYLVTYGRPLTELRERTSQEYYDAVTAIIEGPDIKVCWQDPVLNSFQEGLTEPVEKPPCNSYLGLDPLLPTPALQVFEPVESMNELESRCVEDVMRKTVVDIDSLVMKVNARGNLVKPYVESYSYGPGYGKHFATGDNFQTLAVIANRYDNRDPVPSVTPEAIDFARDVIDNYFATYKNPDALPFDQWIDDDARMAEATQIWIKDAQFRHYFEQFTGSNKFDETLIRFHLKRIFKPDSMFKPVDPWKAGQGISAWSSQAIVRYGLACRVMAAYDRYTELDNKHDIALTDTSKTDEVFMLLANLHMRKNFPNGLRKLYGVGDFAKFDGTQNPMTREVESMYNKRLGFPVWFVDEYFGFQNKMKMYFGFGSSETDRKTSGAPWTLYGNSTIAKVTTAFSLNVKGSSLFLYKGDDTLMIAPDLTVDDAAVKRIKMHFGLDMQVKIGASGEFCGMIVTQDGLFPDVYRKLLRVTATKFRDYAHFAEYQVSLRDALNQMRTLGLNNAIAATAINRGMTFHAANEVYYALESFSHLNEEQFFQTFPKRIDRTVIPAVEENSKYGISFE